MIKKSESTSGFSIVELMVAMTLGILLSGVILDVTLGSSRSNRVIELNSEMIENGRYTTNLLKNEIRLAGFYGRLETYSTALAVPPDECTGLTLADLTTGMTFPLSGLDEVAAGTTVCGGDTLLAGSDVLLIRRADTSFVTTTAGLTNAQHYLQTTITDRVLDIGSATTFTLTSKDGVTLAPIRKYHQDIYYVDQLNVFKRLRLVNGAYTTEPLVEGVDDFQVVYGIDTSGNGISNQDVELPTTTADWENVVSIKFFLLMSSTNAAPGLDDVKTYAYADKSGVTFPDSKKRRLFSSVARLANVSMKRAGQ